MRSKRNGETGPAGRPPPEIALTILAQIAAMRSRPPNPLSVPSHRNRTPPYYTLRLQGSQVRKNIRLAPIDSDHALAFAVYQSYRSGSGHMNTAPRNRDGRSRVFGDPPSPRLRRTSETKPAELRAAVRQASSLGCALRRPNGDVCGNDGCEVRGAAGGERGPRHHLGGRPARHGHGRAVVGLVR